MNGINIDKWRVLNKPLFEAYILTYSRLKENPNLSAAETLVKSFNECGILESLTSEGYGTAYTIAREIGIYYEEEGKYVLSKMSESFLNGKLTYQDFLKYYCLNIEFLINDEVVHPFLEILEVLNGQELDKNDISQRCKKLVPNPAISSVVDCLRLFLNRCLEAELLVYQGGKYKLAYSYNLLLGSINKSEFNPIQFEQNFISGDQKKAQKNIITILLERDIKQLFENSFKLISNNPKDFNKIKNINFSEIEFDNKMLKSFQDKTNENGLIFSDLLIHRFVASLSTKPFVILSGLSGSGKTKLAQSFVQWICENENQYKIVPVGADWTNREPLLGYPNGLKQEEYITPDSGVIHLFLEAVKEGNENKPFFLILDEMNLSHVERYFADFLSVMESDDTIKLYTGSQRKSLDGLSIPLEIGWPKNVFIIGTVNIDETTYMFSPKVLDRANVIEFRITENEISNFLASPSFTKLKVPKGDGSSFAEDFFSIVNKDEIVNNEKIASELVSFFKQLQPVGAEFGYRSATEIMQLVAKLKTLDTSIDDNDCLDIAIMQKLLPKLHGSRSKLVKILIALAWLCIKDMEKEVFEKNFEDNCKNDFKNIKVKYPISFEKLIRMYKNVLANGFTSYAEA